MNNFQSWQDSNITSQNNEGKLSHDELKSVFYLLKGEADSELRLLQSGKVLELADIINIHDQIEGKLINHQIVTNIISIYFILSNNKIKNYSNWIEFKRENWDYINETVQSFSINWDFLIKLPQYQVPQKHSIKLRIGTPIPPRDILQLFLTSDNVSELLEAGASGVCKVDFLNNIIANELLNIVKHWHEGLRESPGLKSFQSFLKKQGGNISQIIRMSTPILLLILYNLYSDYIYYFFSIEKELSIQNLQNILILLISVFTIGLYIGRKIEGLLDSKIEDLEEYPRFNITKGDKNAINRIEKNNQNLTKQIVNRIIWIFLSVLISYLMKYFISYVSEYSI